LIAADGGGLTLLKEEFPNLETIHLPGYRMRYSGTKSMNWQVLASIPKIFYRIYQEHSKLKQLIAQHKLDAIISDNRYGLWSKKVYSVFITHQIMIKCPPGLKFLEPILRGITGYFIRKYDRCWVPDMKDANNLSGDLSHERILPSLKFIGPLSRFSHANGTSHAKKYDLMVSLSGPEPQRTIFEELIMEQLKESQLKSIVVRGLPDEMSSSVNGAVVHSHLNTEDMLNAMLASDVVLSRPGYSTIMDLAAVGKKAVLIPTPGQTEQEYLAGSMKERGVFYSVSQGDFNLETALDSTHKFSGITMKPQPALLKEAVENLLAKI